MRRSVSLTVVVLGMVLLAGCVGPLQTSTDTSGDESTISVSADGTATADPDLAVVSLSVETTADSADAARAQVATDVERVRAALRDADVPEANVTTTAFALSPVYDYTDGERTLTGYRAIHALAVEASPDRAGEVIDVAVGAGATGVDDVRFTLSDERRTDLRATALDRAMAAARTDADGIAAAADLSVTSVESASTTAEFRPFPVARAEDAAGGGTVITPAPVTVSASVSVTYRASA